MSHRRDRNQEFRKEMQEKMKKHAEPQISYVETTDDIIKKYVNIARENGEPLMFLCPYIPLAENGIKPMNETTQYKMASSLVNSDINLIDNDISMKIFMHQLLAGKRSMVGMMEAPGPAFMIWRLELFGLNSWHIVALTNAVFLNEKNEIDSIHLFIRVENGEIIASTVCKRENGKLLIQPEFLEMIKKDDEPKSA